MTNEQILEKQVEALEKLLQLRSAIIEELEIKVASLQNEVARQNLNPFPMTITTTPWIGQPYGVGGGVITSPNTCPDGTPHNYAHPHSNGINTYCIKCGCSNLITGGNIGVATTGYIAPASPNDLAQANGTNIAGQNTTHTNVRALTNVAKQLFIRF